MEQDILKDWIEPEYLKEVLKYIPKGRLESIKMLTDIAVAEADKMDLAEGTHSVFGKNSGTSLEQLMVWDTGVSTRITVRNDIKTSPKGDMRLYIPGTLQIKLEQKKNGRRIIDDIDYFSKDSKDVSKLNIHFSSLRSLQGTTIITVKYFNNPKMAIGRGMLKGTNFCISRTIQLKDGKIVKKPIHKYTGKRLLMKLSDIKITETGFIKRLCSIREGVLEYLAKTKELERVGETFDF